MSLCLGALKVAREEVLQVVDPGFDSLASGLRELTH